MAAWSHGRNAPYDRCVGNLSLSIDNQQSCITCYLWASSFKSNCNVNIILCIIQDWYPKSALHDSIPIDEVQNRLCFQQLTRTPGRRNTP